MRTEYHAKADDNDGPEGEADAFRRPGAGDDDETGLPPFVSSWGGFYRLVLGAFLALILLFYGIQAYFA